MSRDIYETDVLKVTSFAGPMEHAGEPTRMRLQITVLTSDRFASLGFGDVVELRRVLDAWIASVRGGS